MLTLCGSPSSNGKPCIKFVGERPRAHKLVPDHRLASALA